MIGYRACIIYSIVVEYTVWVLQVFCSFLLSIVSMRLFTVQFMSTHCVQYDLLPGKGIYDCNLKFKLSLN